MSETDAEFVVRMRKLFPMQGLARLFDLASRGAEAADEIAALRAEITRLRAVITQAIRQHEEGNKGLAHRTLCEAVYGPQA